MNESTDKDYRMIDIRIDSKSKSLCKPHFTTTLVVISLNNNAFSWLRPLRSEDRVGVDQNTVNAKTTARSWKKRCLHVTSLPKGSKMRFIFSAVRTLHITLLLYWYYTEIALLVWRIVSALPLSSNHFDRIACSYSEVTEKLFLSKAGAETDSIGYCNPDLICVWYHWMDNDIQNSMIKSNISRPDGKQDLNISHDVADLWKQQQH